MLIFTLLTILRVAFVGDPQVDNATELSFARASIYSELRARDDLDLVIVLGDIVNENPSLIPESEATLDSLKCPWVRIHGNHDGKVVPKDTTFFAGGVRFVLLNSNVLPDTTYVGKTVICAHVPFKAEELKQDSPDILYALAHLHRVIREPYPGGSECFIAGATCGTWWRGPKDDKGIPYALMGCGAPRGYFIADFNPKREKWYSLRYKCVDKPESFQAKAWYREGMLVVDVFGGSTEGVLEAKVGGKWVRMVHTDMIDPEVADLIRYNKSLTREQRRALKDEYMPMLHSTSTHIWSTGMSERPGDAIRIRYRDHAMAFRSVVRLSD